LASTTSPDGRSEFLRQLLEIQQDPLVRGLARREAGSLDLAEDALQEAFYAVAKVPHPEQIEIPRAYFCRVLVREAHRLRGQLRAYPVDDVAVLADVRQNVLVNAAPAPSVDETVSWRLRARAWLERFAAQRAHLMQKVPGRSPDPVRYKQLIVSVAERVLLSIASGDVSDADANWALSAAYPEWFAGEGCAVANGHQRLSRARGDVCRILQLIVKRADLFP
jgi:DNA-directed RNA polymerase specialized sigma24 family protein